MENESEPQKIQIVGPVQTNTVNPWRTQGEYREEQARMLKAYRWAVATSIAAIVTAVFTVILAVTAVIEIKHISQSTQEQQVKQALNTKGNH